MSISAEFVIGAFGLLNEEWLAEDQAQKVADVLSSNDELLAFLILKLGCFDDDPVVRSELADVASDIATPFSVRPPQPARGVGNTDEMWRALKEVLDRQAGDRKYLEDASQALRRAALGWDDNGTPVDFHYRIDLER